MYNLFGADLSLLGIYLPMLVVEPAVIKRMESNDLETVGEAFRRGINNTIGICFSVLLYSHYKLFYVGIHAIASQRTKNLE